MALLESSGHFDQDAHVRIAMKYLEEKKVKTLLRDLTQSLLLAQPADPRSYILEELRSETSGPSGSSSSTNACAFLKSSRSSARDAVRELLRRAKDGLAVRAVSFFSAPKGRGRDVLGLGDASQLSGDAFLLVDSSDGRSQGEAGSSVVAECLGSALASESGAAADTCVAWPVRSAQGVEGVLLAELNLPAEVSETLSSLQLYALLLEERLNCIHWEAEARRSAAVVESLLQGVEVLAKPSEEWRESNIQNAAEVPKEVLRGGIELPVASVWEADDRLGSFVKVGGAEGRNSPSTLTTEAFRLSSEDAARVICAEGSWDGSGSKPTSSREICIVLHGIGKPTVLDFSDDPSSKAVEPLRLDHFDIVAAESLCASSLRAALQAQSMLSELTKRKHSAEQMQSLVSELSMTASTTDLVLSIEKAVQAVTQSSRCMVFFIDDDEAWAPPTATVPEPARMVLDVGLPGRIAMLAKERSEPLGALIYNDPATCPYWDDVEFGVDQNASVMVAPIMSAGKDLKPLGLIVASAKTSRSKEGDLLSKLWGPISVDFTQQDADFLEWLASAASSHLDRLSLDVMWTRALLEREGEGAAQDESEDLLVSEYYTEEAMATRSRARTDGSTGRTGSKASGHGRSVGRVNTVHKFTGHVATALDFTSSKGMLALVQEVEKTCIRDLTAEPHVDVSQWEIDYWVLTSHEQFVLLVTAIRQLDIFDHLSIDDGVLMRFFQAVKSTYRSVPFHNFHHAMSTTHYASKMAKVADLSAYLTYPELFALVIGALCHDLDHRGYNNAFEIMTRSELALRYNDSSPLENHHCARAFETALNGVDCNIFEDLGPEVYNLVRKRMVAGILATDMKHHGEHVGILKEFEVGEPSDSQSQFLVEVLMHAADISNPFMPPDKSKRWAVCLNEEFSLQAEKEAELGLPVTSFMSGLHEPQVAAKSLLGFIDFVVTPFTSSVFRLFPDLAELKKFLDQNREAAAIIVEEATSSDRRPAKKSWQSALTRLRGTKDSTGSTNP